MWCFFGVLVWGGRTLSRSDSKIRDGTGRTSAVPQCFQPARLSFLNWLEFCLVEKRIQSVSGIKKTGSGATPPFLSLSTLLPQPTPWFLSPGRHSGPLGRGIFPCEALGEAVAGRAVRIGVCVCVTATSVTATQDQWVCIINNEGALKRKHPA